MEDVCIVWKAGDDDYRYITVYTGVGAGACMFRHDGWGRRM
jgi:hypothetical protein